MIVGSVVEDGADPPPDTSAWLTWGDDAVARTFTRTVMLVALAPGGIVPAERVQVNPAQLHPIPGVTEAKTRPGGSVSVTVTVPEVVPAPTAFDTVSV
jgi:hypothetical protein